MTPIQSFSKRFNRKVYKEDIKGQVQMFWSKACSPSPWVFLLFKQPHCLSSPQKYTNYTVTLPVKTLLLLLSLTHSRKGDFSLHCLINILGDILGQLSPTTSHSSAFCLYKCTSTWRRGWEHASSLKHPVLTPDCKDHESSPPPRTSAVCTATGIHKTLALYANRWGHQPTWAQSAEKQSYLFPVHGNTRTS